MDICDVCGRSIAEFLCLCSPSFLRICNGCVGNHVTKPSQASHSLEPIACRLFLSEPGGLARYQTRQLTVRMANEALDQNLKDIEAYKSALQSLISTVNTWATEKLRQIEPVEVQIRADINACKEKNKELMKTSEAPVDSKLVEVVIGTDRGKEGQTVPELRMFHCGIVGEDVVTSLFEGLFSYKVSLSPLLLTPSTSPSLPPQSQPQPTDPIKGLSLRIKQLELTVKRQEEELKEKSQCIAVLQQQISKLPSEQRVPTRTAQTLPTFPLTGSIKSGQEVHVGIFCDGCKLQPLVGPRWECLVCPSYDLCQACHLTVSHPHAFKRTMLR